MPFVCLTGLFFHGHHGLGRVPQWPIPRKTVMECWRDVSPDTLLGTRPRCQSTEGEANKQS